MSVNFTPEDVVPLPCRRPTFRGQNVITDTARYLLDDENSVILMKNILTEQELADYLSGACTVERQSSRSAFGMKPRREVCYSVDGEPYVYSRIKHHTVKYPQHVLNMLEICMAQINEIMPDNPYTVLSTGVEDFPSVPNPHNHLPHIFSFFLSFAFVFCYCDEVERRKRRRRC